MPAAALLLAALAGPLSVLEDYAGHCWVTQVNATTTDRHCFSAVYGGAHVRDEHVVVGAGKTIYAGETIYSVVEGRIVFTYWNSLGGSGTGTARAGAPGELVFELTMRGTPAAAPTRLATTWRRSASGYDVITGGRTNRFTRAD